MELIFIVLVALAVVYKLGLFNPIVDLSEVASRESNKYNRDHKAKVAKGYLNKDFAMSEADIKKVNDNIKAIDALKFD